MSAAFIDEDFTPVTPPLHGIAAEADQRQREIKADTVRLFAAQDARLKEYAAKAKRQQQIDKALANLRTVFA